MSDDELIRDFEALRLAPGQFGHRAHVRLAFAYLQRYDLLEALRRCRDGLRRFARAAGAPDKYHETVTFGLVILIHERMARAPGPQDWDGFAAANPDLLAWPDGALFDYYPPEILDSELARRTFVLPGPVAAGVSA